MLIHTCIVSDYQQNARVLIDEKNKKACLVDPGAEIDRLMDLVNPEENILESIFLTHCHIDHAGGVQHVLAYCDEHGLERPKVYYHHLEIPVGQFVEQYAVMSGLSPEVYRNPPEPDVDLAGEATFSVGDYEGKVFFTPGHAPGHVVLLFEQTGIQLLGDCVEPVNDRPVLIAGDTLFRQSIGRTDLPGGHHETLLNSIRTVHFAMDDDTLVLPGHGPNTTIGFEKRSNPFMV